MYTIRRVCLPENAPEQAVYAAGELRYYVSLMCAKPCPVQSEVTEDAVYDAASSPPSAKKSPPCRRCKLS